ncbi:hypothetical protein [Halobacteriovorax sp. HLS]|uniref:hypothetical protein n=1 Tax=Halobacteriovorax sp. HLS TaxID=2234000 RepID=UPI000FD6BD91|nr:hypothetical protein [Halobacteriovorax sp. HLS]
MSYILVNKNESHSKAISLQLKTKFSIDIILYTTLEQARGMLEILPDIKGVLLLASVSASDMEYFLKKTESLDFKLIVPREQPSGEKCTLWETNEDLIDFIAEQEKTEQSTEGDFCKFPVSHLNILKSAPVDYYLMIGDNRKFLKVINKSDSDFQEALSKVHARKIKYLYVHNEDVPMMLKSVEKIFHDTSVKKKEVDFIKVQEEVYGLMQSVGLSESALNLAQESIEGITDRLSSSKDTKKLLNSLYVNSTSKSYQLTYMTAVVSVNLLSQFSWSTKEMRVALINAAFFNDIKLEGDDVFHRNLESIKNIKGTKNIEILEHASKTAEFLEKTSLSQLQQTCKIVREHHGERSGVGFSYNLSGISKLSDIFIVSEEFCIDMIHAKGGKINIGNILKSISQRYSGKFVNEYCQALLNIFKG